ALLVLHGGRSPTASSRRPLIATALLAAAALVKFVAGVPLVLLAIADVANREPGTRLRRAAAHGGTALAVALAGYLPFAQRHDLTFGLAYLFPFASLVAPMMVVNNTVVDAVYRWLGLDASMAAAAVVRLVFAGAFAASFVLIGRSIVRSGPEERARRSVVACAWALVLVALSFQWLYPWYCAWFAPLAWAMPRRLRAAALGLSAVLPLSTIVVSGDAAPSISRGLGRLCYLVIAPALLAVLLMLLRDVVRDQRSDEGEPIALVPSVAKG
ncbi:MAG: hypothetical protein ACXVQU_10075, partial [Actinomycetota bacterium]